MGFGFALVTLMVAGMLRVPLKDYIPLNLLGGFIWTAVLVAIGYFFGDIYSSITGPEKIVFACLTFVGLAIVLRLANKYLITKDI